MTPETKSQMGLCPCGWEQEPSQVATFTVQLPESTCCVFLFLFRHFPEHI